MLIVCDQQAIDRTSSILNTYKYKYLVKISVFRKSNCVIKIKLRSLQINTLT